LQSKELHDSTEQLTASATALALQNNVMVRQQFETTFFQMLGLFNEVVKEAEFFSDTIERQGFKFIKKVIGFKGRLCLIHLVEIIKQLDVRIENNNFARQYHNQIHDKYRYVLAPYFRTLYSIINFVDKSNFGDDDKSFYINIVRAQLSEHELVLLFYNCLSLPNAASKLLPLVKKYNLLKNLNRKLLANSEHFKLLPL
jgi:Putative phage abortive infection protein